MAPPPLGCAAHGATAVAADSVTTADDLLNALEKHRVGDTIKIDIIRSDKRIQVPVRLQAVR